MKALPNLFAAKARLFAPLLCLLLAGVALFPGCAALNGYPDRSGNTKVELRQLDIYYQTNILANYNSKTNTADRKSFRDDVVNGRVRATDIHYTDFERALTKSSVYKNIGVDWSVLALNAAGVIVPAASSKAIFAGISGGLVGANGSVDKNAFYEKTLPALLAKMEALRKQQLVVIRHGLALSTDDYPLIQALADVDAYYTAGTIPGAILDITGDAGAATKQADAEIKGIYTKDSAGDLLRRYWKPDGKTVNTENQTKLEAAIKANTADWMTQQKTTEPPSVLFFLRDKDFVAARAKVAKDLELQ